MSFRFFCPSRSKPRVPTVWPPTVESVLSTGRSAPEFKFADGSSPDWSASEEFYILDDWGILVPVKEFSTNSVIPRAYPFLADRAVAPAKVNARYFTFQPPPFPAASMLAKPPSATPASRESLRAAKDAVERLYHVTEQLEA